ncbi:hypothetical protein M3P21_05080 [Ruegeria sp. 2012CJ41-6]|uniref:Uncharacterized protein n=1 Tax=Ruegeria spongiae TaxID=2942209 RepID=A0ABT0PZ88_9RHOB|nr:hypothetical protein [Ruegeria spongiae]MCL6282900.1 hypothetical protein [Ruegeria spongiae]
MKLSETPTPTAQEALDYLEEAWAYFCPVPVETKSEEQEPDLFQYANAA